MDTRHDFVPSSPAVSQDFLCIHFIGKSLFVIISVHLLPPLLDPLLLGTLETILFFLCSLSRLSHDNHSIHFDT
jgi:hypothetical protein